MTRQQRRSGDRPRDPLPALARFAKAAALPGQPSLALAALDSVLGEAVGHKLFTLLVVDLQKNENRRCYSSHPGAYPVGGAKPIDRDGIITRTVILAGRCHINRDYADMQRVFKDHALVRSLGCEGSINVPIRWNGVTLGMFNLSNEAGWYGDADIPLLLVFAAMAVPVVRDIFVHGAL